MSRFKVNEEAGILHVRFLGEANFQIFEEYLQYITGIKLSSQLKILHDNRESIPQLRPGKMVELAQLFERYLGKQEEVRIAYIHENPLGIALAQLFKDHLKSAQFKVEIFSGKEAALDWLSPE